ncbi:MAG: diguanylate cyclase [Acidimicrobiia bacterium]|nr:diguanylate cyclase [Acidimicrobiia bacterium]
MANRVAWSWRTTARCSSTRLATCRSSPKRSSCEPQPGVVVQIGVSIGAAVFPHDGDTYEAMLATADSRMYRDKTQRKRGHQTHDTGEIQAAV